MSEKIVGYLGADCPGCGRSRLELFADERERALGVRCEKCFSTWPFTVPADEVLIYGPFFTTQPSEETT